LLGGGHWRLPTKIELESIVDETWTMPAIDPQAFPNTPTAGAGFWTASRSLFQPTQLTVVLQGGEWIWCVFFDDGRTNVVNIPGSSALVRCVR
jgi:L-lactate utilization protein LutB